MSIQQNKLFDYKTKADFPEKLTQWVGDVFYDILPEQGYEIRDEQIYTAFQIAEAVAKKRIHLAEAGLGIGKTFAYLLTGLAYARFTGKPVIIACASTALQEQLSGPGGDIETLARILGVEIDARMAKDPRQYICDIRVNEFETSNTLNRDISEWVEQTKSGERSEIPHVSDEIWKQIGWDTSMSCDKCANRGFCKLVKAKQYYRSAKDLIIADHSIFFEDLWTRDEQIAEGKLPMLPDYSAVIFDEGHKIILPALMSAGQQINQEAFDEIILSLEQIQDARESLVSIVMDLDQVLPDFFTKLNQRLIQDDVSKRLGFTIDDTLLQSAETLRKTFDALLLELQIEQELYFESLPISVFQIYEARIEAATIGLSLFVKNQAKDVITWMDKEDRSFWVVPRHVDQMLQKHLFQKALPIVFTSATLSNKGDFSYFSRIFGLNNPSSSTVESTFDFKNQVSVYIQQPSKNKGEDERFAQKITELVSLLEMNQGSALVLTNSLNETEKIKEALKSYAFPYEFLWEDEGERGFLVRKFKEDISSVLIGSNFWEGIDVPGIALSLLIIWEIPFPSLDPLIEVRRKEVAKDGLDPRTIVDYPEMGLKLKQGCGRLIRTRDDQGKIAILEPFLGKYWEDVVIGALPQGVEIK